MAKDSKTPLEVFPEMQEEKIPQGFHDLTHRFSTTFGPGTCVPLAWDEVLPGDSMTYSLTGRLESFPMLAPCLDGYKFRVSTYFWALSNAYGFLDNNNKLSTDEFINRQEFLRAVLVPLLPGPRTSDLFHIPTEDSESLPESVLFWTDSTFGSNVLRDGVAAGSLLNHFGFPVGYSGSSWNTASQYYEAAKALDTPGSVPVSGDLQRVLAYETNFHVLLAYMDAYRIGLLNNQEDTCYYVAPVIETRDYLAGLDGTEHLLAADAKKVLCYGYRGISLRSLDNFFMALRSYTASVRFTPYGEDIGFSLSSNVGLSNFVSYIANAMLASIGKYVNGTEVFNPTDETRDAVSALRFFLEVTGLMARVPGMYGEPVPGSGVHGAIAKPTFWYLDEADMQAALYTPFAPNCGLLLATYEMDLNRGLLSTAVGMTKSVVDTTGNSFSIDVFRFRNSVQKVIDRFDLSGGRLSSWLRKFWKVKPDRSLDTAVLLHVNTSVIGSTDIISQAATEGAALAQQAGYTIGTVKGDDDHFQADTYGVLVRIGTLVPLVSYSQGLHPYFFRKSFQDIFLKEYANIGFQDVPMKYLLAVTNLIGSDNLEHDTDPDDVVARRPAFQDYRAAVATTSGLFASGAPLSYWALNRFYQVTYAQSDQVASSGVVPAQGLRYDVNSRSFSTYVFPRLYNYLFTQTDDSSQNFRLAGSVVFKGTRNVPAPQMPSL